MGVAFDVFGRPGPKGSHQPGKGKLRNQSKIGEAWENTVATTCLAVRGRFAAEGIKPPYAVYIVLRFLRPANPTYGWPVIGDIDKHARATIDGLQTGLMIDDKHITCLRVDDDYVPDASLEGASVIVSHDERFDRVER